MRSFGFGFLVAVLIGCFCPNQVAAADKVHIRLGSLPVLQALPIYVAEERGLFSANGIDVEIIPFNTAAEKDIALTSGSIDGYFGDLLTPIVLKGNGRDVVITAKTYDTAYDKRMFGILAKPGSNYESAKDLSDVPVAVASNSVVDYVTDALLRKNGVPAEKIKTIEAKNIGLRMQMVMTGQVEAAALPEPLVTAALDKGAKLLADDSGLSESQTVLVFNTPFAKNNPAAVKKFLEVCEKARLTINDEPDAVRPIMVKHVRLPEALQRSYPVPRFPKVGAPDRDAVNTISAWLKDRGIIKSVITYEQVVDVNFLP